jgi:5-guanidino-2-oxopentanoate decarboxylase
VRKIPEKNGGWSVLRTIRSYGVDTIFGIPGTHNLEFYRHLSSLHIKPITSRHEQGAGYAAIGWSLQTGLPGVVITTSGPGLLNVLSAFGTAFCESVPLIVLSPGVSRGQEFADNGSLHETKDSIGATGAIGLWSRRPSTARDAVELIHEAFALFATNRPRPVHIEVPLDVLESKAGIAGQILEKRTPRGENRLNANELGLGVEALTSAKNPVVVSGGGSAIAAVELRKLAESLGAPVVSTINGKAVLPESHPLSVGSELRLPSAQALVNTADVAVLVGTKMGVEEFWGGVISPEGTVIRIDRDPSQKNKNVLSNIALIGDSGAVLKEINDSLSLASAPIYGWLGELGFQELRERLRREAVRISPFLMTIAEEISAAIPRDAVVSGDSSQITYLAMTSTTRLDQPRSFLYPAAYATLGFGLPAAIGAKIASPTRPVVCVVGDGALMFSLQEMITASEQRLDLTLVCVDNGGYGEIRQNQIDRGIQPVGVDLHQPDWLSVATGLGFASRRVVTHSGIRPSIESAIQMGGLQFVHIPLESLSK